MSAHSRIWGVGNMAAHKSLMVGQQLNFLMVTLPWLDSLFVR